MPPTTGMPPSRRPNPRDASPDCDACHPEADTILHATSPYLCRRHRRVLHELLRGHTLPEIETVEG